MSMLIADQGVPVQACPRCGTKNGNSAVACIFCYAPMHIAVRDIKVPARKHWRYSLLVCSLFIIPATTWLICGRDRTSDPLSVESTAYVSGSPVVTVQQPGGLAKYEPARGCYIGAFIDFDNMLNSPFKDQNGRVHQDPAAFEEFVGKPHAMYFFYLGYGKPLPLDWVKLLGQRGKFVHIALEPNDGLEFVENNEYLNSLADDMQRSGAKIFLRFASEMNGDWTNYHGNPTLYKSKFRMISKVMRNRAPNVAMVWCPYATPKYNISYYYPGDDAVDWVGVNFYNVTHHNNNVNAPSIYEHPTLLLSYVYHKYSARKPIMICEYGATHRSATLNYTCPYFARRKITTLYTALPTKFPRVKCINYFNGNNMDFLPLRAANDYSVTNDPIVLTSYRQAIASDYYLSAPAGTRPIHSRKWWWPHLKSL